MRVLDHRQQLDVVVPGGDRLLLLEAPPGGLALRRPPVVVEEVGEAREEDLLEREARPVVAVRTPADPEVVGHGGDRLPLVELAVAR